MIKYLCRLFINNHLQSTNSTRPEVNLGPWEEEFKSIKDGSRKQRWRKKYPYAYWKGNPVVSPIREALLECNNTEQWGALIMRQVQFC